MVARSIIGSSGLVSSFLTEYICDDDKCSALENTTIERNTTIIMKDMFEVANQIKRNGWFCPLQQEFAINF